MYTKYKFRSKIWLYPGIAAWYFVTLPKTQSNKILKLFGDIAHGFNSLPVNVTLGKTTWKTSIFYDRKSKAYLMALKAMVRKKENLKLGDTVDYRIEILVYLL